MSGATGDAGGRAITAWVCCVRVNDSHKAYLTRQVASFEEIDARLLVWEDERAERSSPDSDQVPSPWRPHRGRRGQDFLRRTLDAVRCRFRRNVHGATDAESRYFEQRDPPDVIYAHTGPMGLRMLPVAEHFDVPLVVHFHGIDVTRTDTAYRVTMGRNIGRFSSVLVVGEWMKDRIAAFGGSHGDILTVPMGAPSTLEATPTDRSGSSGFSFVCVGRLVPTKGVDRIIRAFAIVSRQRSDARLTIVGDGPSRIELNELVSDLGLDGRVEFTGALASDETHGVIARSDVLVHHPIDAGGGTEAFGVVVAEAMMLARPVIASICGGLVDQVDHGRTGFLVEQDDIEALAEHMLTLRDDPVRASEMGRAGRCRSVDRFDSRALAAKVEQHLVEVAARHPKVRARNANDAPSLPPASLPPT